MAGRAEMNVLVKADLDLLRELRRASSAADKILRGLRGDQTVKRARTLVVKREIEGEVRATWRRLDAIVQSRRADASVAAVEDSLRQELGRLPKNLHKYLLKNSRQGLDALEARLNVTKTTLSERISSSLALQRGTIDRLVNAALATEVSEDDLAAQLKRYMRPDAPGGASFAARRIARTEIGNAYHASMIQRAIDSGNDLEWVLAGSHRVPDECNRLSKRVFRARKCPLKPHPLCLCTIKIVRRSP